MALFLAEPIAKVEYVYPFVCGLCGFGSGNIDEFHHHFETHADLIPSSVFHLCEFEVTRDDETTSQINIGSFNCSTCNHTFPTVCHLAKHLDDDSNTDKYTMDLQTKTAYPNTSQGAAVITHTFINVRNKKKTKVSQNREGKVAQNKKGKKVVSRNNNRSRKSSSSTNLTGNTSQKGKKCGAKAQDRSEKMGSKKTSDKTPDPSLTESLLQEAQNVQNATFDILHSMDHLDNANGLDAKTDEVQIVQNSVDENNVESGTKMARNTSRKGKKTATKARKKDGKTRSMQTFTDQTHTANPVKKLLQEAQTQQNATYDILYSMDHLDYNVDSANDSDSNTQEVNVLQNNVNGSIGDPRPALEVSPFEWINCIYCGLSFRKQQKKQLKEHEEEHLTHEGNLEHTAESLYKCVQCSCVMKRVNSHLHMCPIQRKFRKRRRRAKKIKPKTSLDQTPTPCPRCSKIFKKYYLRTHILQVHVVHEPIPCQICGQLRKNKYSLTKHIANVHKGENKFKCQKCYRRYISRQKFMLHMKKHENTQKFQCDRCLNNYNDSQSLEAHKEVLHTQGKERELFYCGFCPKKYGYKDGLSQHQRNVHSVTVKPNDNIKKKAVSEEQEENYNCDKCLKKFLLQCSLNVHLRKHMEYLTKLPYPCDVCPEKYYTKDSLTKHKKRKHCEASQNTVFECDKCPKSFAYSDSLKKHQRRRHKPGDNWQFCGWKSCRHKFKTTSEVEAHRIIHKDAVEFCCDACDKTFMTMLGLTLHTRNIHQQRQAHTDHTYLAEGTGVSQTSSHNLLIESSGSDRCSIKKETVEEPSSGKDPSLDAHTQTVKEEAGIGPSSVALPTQSVGETTQIHPSSFEEDTKDNLVEGGNKAETTENAFHHVEQDLNNASEELFTATRLPDHDYAAVENGPRHYTVYSNLKRHQMKEQETQGPSHNTAESNLKRQKMKEQETQDIQEHRCEQCPKVYVQINSLRQHIKRSHTPIDTRFPCTSGSCRQKFLTHAELVEHNKSHESFQCKMCPKIFLKKEGLRRHTSVAHSETTSDKT